MPTEQYPSRAARLIAALASHRASVVGGVLIAAAVIGLYEWVYASPARAEQRTLAQEIARTTAQNAEIVRTVSSPEATAAWLAHVEDVDRTWTENLKKIPPAEKVEQQYDKLAALTSRSGIKQQSFERLNLARVAATPGRAPDASDVATSVSPAIELRRVKISFLATADSLGAFLAEIQKGADERLLSVAEYTVAVTNDQPGYSMRVEMVLNVYFKKRDAATVAP